MNFAFVTIILLFLILPGFIMRRAYLSGEYSKNTLKHKALESLTWSIFPGMLLQAIALMIYSWFGYDIQLHKAYPLLIGSTDQLDTSLALELFQEHLGVIILYQTTLVLLAWSLGLLLRQTVRFYKLDLKYKAYRFSNNWYYILTGECLKFGPKPPQVTPADVIIADVLMKTDEGSILYTGILSQSFIDDSGNLESLIIKGAKRRNLNPSKPSGFREFESSILVLQNKDIININLRYLKLNQLVGPKKNIIAKHYFSPLVLLIITMWLFGLALLNNHTLIGNHSTLLVRIYLAVTIVFIVIKVIFSWWNWKKNE